MKTADKTFVRTVQIRFREGDPVGIMYFANVFSLAHDTFEEFIEAAGVPWKEWFKSNKYFVPIRHTECDYKAAFRPGEKYEIVAQVAKLGESTFHMQYIFQKGKQVHAIVKMSHTFVDPKRMEKTKMPSDFRSKLAHYLSETSHE
jgi:acyl-CoA thioester hydrolase/1,4-dihydroxy-2-naphthoyl-CoA hydrolase